MAQPFIARRPIFIGNALGYAPGDIVSDQVVNDHELGSDDVARQGTKAAEAVSGSPDPALQQDSTTPPKK